jgi:hypothetical protein
MPVIVSQVVLKRRHSSPITTLVNPSDHANPKRQQGLPRATGVGIAVGVARRPPGARRVSPDPAVLPARRAGRVSPDPAVLPARRAGRVFPDPAVLPARRAGRGSPDPAVLPARQVSPAYCRPRFQRCSCLQSLLPRKETYRSSIWAGSGDPRPARSSIWAGSGDPRPARSSIWARSGDPRPARAGSRVAYNKCATSKLSRRFGIAPAEPQGIAAAARLTSLVVELRRADRGYPSLRL